MTERTRRSLLYGTAGSLALTAGCVTDDAVESPGSGGDSENGTDDDETDADESADGDPTEPRAFRHAERTAEPNAVLFLEREGTEEWLAERQFDDEESVSAFVEETSFEDSSLTAVEAAAPDLCYELNLESAAVEEGRLELEAEVVDEATDEMGCGQQETTVGVLVRASDDGEPVDEGIATLGDHEGEERELEIDDGDDSDDEYSDSAADDDATAADDSNSE